MVQKRKNKSKTCKKNIKSNSVPILSLYKSLLSSSFLIVEGALVDKNLFRYGVFVFKAKALYLLEINQTLVSLKQLLKNIMFIKSKGPSSIIRIMASNKQYYYLLKTYLKRYQLSANNLIVQNFCFLQVPNSIFKAELGLILEDSISVYNKKSSKLYNLFLNNLFFITEVNFNKNNTKFGTYQIYNDLNDFRKVVFLLSILNLFLKKT
jgi:hypothetical protein